MKTKHTNSIDDTFYRQLKEKGLTVCDLTVWEYKQIELLIEQQITKMKERNDSAFEKEIKRFTDFYWKIKDRGNGAEGGFLISGKPLD